MSSIFPRKMKKATLKKSMLIKWLDSGNRSRLFLAMLFLSSKVAVFTRTLRTLMCNLLETSGKLTQIFCLQMLAVSVLTMLFLYTKVAVFHEDIVDPKCATMPLSLHAKNKIR